MKLTPFAFLLFASFALSQSKPDYAANKKNALAYFDAELKGIEKECLANLTTKEAWEKDRPKMRQQFFEMMGLWPLPAKSDLKATVTGTVEGEGFVVEKLHFQSVPGLYVTANFYRPKKAEGKLPTILYVCGHGNVVENGVSYGSKVFYQYHPAWFATHGYNCLILDTLQLGEIPGEHHGTYKKNWWYWQALGYTPGGVELLNAIRALDYLETRPEVDAKKIGVTGRSGGGATSWWILAADDRPAAFAPIAGIVDLRSHLVEGVAPRLKEGVIAGHCDCMFMVNTYRWDFPQVAALCAPRPLLLGNSDVDDIFPVAGYRRLADKVSKVYKLYGAEDKFQLLETSGPHKDTPELRIGINRFFNRQLKGDATTKVEDDLPPKLPPQQLKVFDKLPEDAINDRLNEIMLAKVPRPEPTKDWRKTNEERLMRALKEQVFGGWPKAPIKFDGKRKEVRNGLPDRLDSEELEFQSDETTRLAVSVVREKKGVPNRIRMMMPATPEGNPFAAIEAGTIAASVDLRGQGGRAWAEPNSLDAIQIRRRFALLGQTLEGMRVWDIRRAIALVGEQKEWIGLPISLEGQGDQAALALYAALFEPSVKEVVLIDPPKTHAEGPIFLNVLKHMDIQQAVALLAPRKVTIRVKSDEDKKAWNWCLQLQEAEAGDWLKVEVAK